MISSDTETVLVGERTSPYDEYLKTHAVVKDLKRKSARGAVATAVDQTANFVLRFGSTAVLARLLTPHDYGLVGMTAVITGFVAVFKDAGLTTATVQRAEISHAQVSMLFWINLLLGCAVAVILVAVSPGVAAIYREPRLTGITCALAVPFVFGGLTLQHQALLRRQMRFAALAVIDIISLSAGIAVSIVMAWSGFGYWSLAGMGITTAVANAVGVWIAMPWRPSWPQKNSGVRPLLKFGSDLLVFDVAHYFSCQADSFLIGWFWGAAPLAYYQKCYVLMMQPVQQITYPFTAVVMPALSRLQNDPSRFRRFYLGVLQLTTSISLPFVFLIVLFAREIVLLVLGPAWLESVPLFRLLAPAAALSAMGYGWGMLLIALGQTQKYRRIGIASGVIVVVSFIVGVPFGTQGVALAYSIALCLMVIPAQWIITRDTPVRLLDVFRSWLPPVVAAIVATIASLLVSKLALAAANQWLSALAAGGTFAGVYLLILMLGFGKWSFFLRILRELKQN